MICVLIWNQLTTNLLDSDFGLKDSLLFSKRLKYFSSRHQTKPHFSLHLHSLSWQKDESNSARRRKLILGLGFFLGFIEPGGQRSPCSSGPNVSSHQSVFVVWLSLCFICSRSKCLWFVFKRPVTHILLCNNQNISTAGSVYLLEPSTLLWGSWFFVLNVHMAPSDMN